METPMIFETHAHYDDEAFAQDRENLLASMQKHGIGHIVNACASVESLKDTEELMEKYPFVYGAFGIHPDDAEKMTEETLEEIRRLSRLPKSVAIGEIGLDYYWHKEEHEHEIQKKMFLAQMEIAREEKLPFMIHSREAAYKRISGILQIPSYRSNSFQEAYSDQYGTWPCKSSVR